MNAHNTSATSGAKPRAPIRRAVAQTIANVASVTTQRHAKSPVTPAVDHSGQTSARKSHAELASGAPYVGQLHSCCVGTACVCQMTRPTSR